MMALKQQIIDLIEKTPQSTEKFTVFEFNRTESKYALQKFEGCQ